MMLQLIYSGFMGFFANPNSFKFNLLATIELGGVVIGDSPEIIIKILIIILIRS